MILFGIYRRTMRKFTPGPWHANRALCAIYADNVMNIRGDDHAEICHYSICQEREIREPGAAANIVLMAQSPDLLNELERSSDLLEDAAKRMPPGSGLETCIRQQIEANNAVIKKALGE